MKRQIQFLILYSIFFCFGLIQVQAKDDPKVIQFSGLVMTSDSLQGIPFVHVYIKHTLKGTISNYEGYFSFAAEKGDSVYFSAVGFKPSMYVIPKDLIEKKYTILKLMTSDTVHIAETQIYPWPKKDQFRSAFLNLDAPDDMLERARKNLEREAMREAGIAMEPDANENADIYLRQQAQKFYYAGQSPPMQIFNPFAWAKFINAWKRGDFKKRGEPYVPQEERTDAPEYEDLMKDEIRY